MKRGHIAMPMSGYDPLDDSIELTPEQEKKRKERFEKQMADQRRQEIEYNEFQTQQETKRISAIMDTIQAHPLVKEYFQIQRDKMAK